MIEIAKSRPITDFARNTRSHVKRLRASGRPEVLTLDGRAALVVQDADAYQRLVKQADYVDTIRTMRRRLSGSARKRRGRPMREALEDIARDFGIRLIKK